MKKYNYITDIFSEKNPFKNPLEEKKIMTLLNKKISYRFVADTSMEFPRLSSELPWLLKITEKDFISILSEKKDLDLATSKRLIYLVEIFLMGRFAFEKENLFVQWLHQKNISLDRKKPISYLGRGFDDIYFMRNLLGKIVHGIPS